MPTLASEVEIVSVLKRGRIQIRVKLSVVEREGSCGYCSCDVEESSSCDMDEGPDLLWAECAERF